MPNVLSNLGNGVCDHPHYDVEYNNVSVVPVLSGIPHQDGIVPAKATELQYFNAPKVVVGHADS